MNWYYSARLDEMLRMFEATGSVPCSVLFGNNSPEDWCLAVSYLVREGYLEEHGDQFEITYKGKALVHDGGFVGKSRRERVLSYCTVVAAVCGVLCLVVSLVALVCQLCGQ